MSMVRILLDSQHDVIISASEVDYDATWGNPLPVYELQPLQLGQIESYLHATLGEVESEHFRTHLHRSKQLLELVSNPLLLSLMSAVVQDQPRARLPIHQHSLLHQFVSH